MIARLLEQESALPTWQDIEVLQSINDVLSPLAEFTDTLSGEKGVIASAIKPLLNLLQNKTLAISSGDATCLATFCPRKEILLNQIR